jgi:hypothetical protein
LMGEHSGKMMDGGAGVSGADLKWLALGDLSPRPPGIYRFRLAPAR